MPNYCGTHMIADVGRWIPLWGRTQGRPTGCCSTSWAGCVSGAAPVSHRRSRAAKGVRLLSVRGDSRVCHDRWSTRRLAASSFTSVSVDPPLVSVCVQNTSTTWPVLQAARRLGLVRAGRTARRGLYEPVAQGRRPVRRCPLGATARRRRPGPRCQRVAGLRAAQRDPAG